MKHLIFFDAECSFCRAAVHKLAKMDKKKIFGFAPLQGKTAQEYRISSLKEEDTLILLEEKKRLWLRAKAFFRILWLLGGVRKIPGVFCFVPGFDILYRLFAKNRHYFGKEVDSLETKEDSRFLP